MEFFEFGAAIFQALLVLLSILLGFFTLSLSIYVYQIRNWAKRTAIAAEQISYNWHVTIQAIAPEKRGTSNEETGS